MEQQQEFAAKLREMDEAYRALSGRILECQNAGHASIRRELSQTKDVCRGDREKLEQRVSKSRNGLLAALYQAQLGFQEQIAGLYLQQQHGADGSFGTGRAEDADDQREADALALCAETLLDQAMNTMNLATLAVLMALDKQMDNEEKRRTPAPAPPIRFSEGRRSV